MQQPAWIPVIVTAHLNADFLNTGADEGERERESEERSVRPAPFQSPCVFARQASSPCELKVLKVPSRRIANCFVASSQGAYCRTELEIPWRGSPEPSAARQDYRIHSPACIYTYVHMQGCRLYTETRDLLRWGGKGAVDAR